jgi:cytidylate kinase
MAVITISRQFGSGGDEIADQLCQVLGYGRFNKRHIIQAAAAAGLSEQEIIDFSEENYKTKNFMDRLLRRGRIVAEARVWKEDARGTQSFETTPISEEHALTMVKSAILSAHRAGDMVIIGRGGQIILKDQPDVIHVRIEAPLEDRIQRAKIEQKLDRRPAQDLIGARDTASADYIRQFYGVDWSDPLLYHLVINTGKVEIEHATQIIVAYVHLLHPVTAQA